MAKDRRYKSNRGFSRSQHSFAMVPSVNIPRSVFNRSHGLKTAFDGGDLIPIFVDEVLPGDTFSLRATLFGRMQVPVRPVMDNIYLDTFFFFVPNRLVWENWAAFNGEHDDAGAQDTVFTVPEFQNETVVEESLSDYLGLPIGNSLPAFNSLVHRSYSLIWNEWFRDENLQDKITVDTDNGPDTLSDYVIRKRNKRHDYFAACLPYTQKGTPVELPLGSTAPVSIAADGDLELEDGTNQSVIRTTGGASGTLQNLTTLSGGVNLEYHDGLQGTADLSSATSATINEIREAFQIQRLLERDARGGTRYTEIIRSHFGVVSPDARLQRPEYLGGSSSPVLLNIVANTANISTTYGSKLGDPAGFHTVGATPGFYKSFTEHGHIIGLANFRADLTYQQGMHRMWSRQTRYEFFWPSLQHLGEQAVLSKEIFSNGGAADENVFGYIGRYDEYRYGVNRVTGVMRSDHTASLDNYHLALDFQTRPTLNSTFIEENPPFNRVVRVSNEPEFFLDCWYEYKCARPMATFGVPGLIDHF